MITLIIKRTYGALLMVNDKGNLPCLTPSLGLLGQFWEGQMHREELQILDDRPLKIEPGCMLL